MSKGRGIKLGGWCLRCAYFGVSTLAVTNLSRNPDYGALYCQECADYLDNEFPPAYMGAERLSPRQFTHHDKEAT